MKTTLKINVEVKKQKKLGNVYLIKVPLYRCSVELLFGKTAQKIEDMWNNGKITWEGNTRNYLEQRRVMVSFKDQNPSKGTVVHELCHATQMILKDAGHNFYEGSKGDEPFAYLLTYLVEQYYEVHKKIK